LDRVFSQPAALFKVSSQIESTPRCGTGYLEPCENPIHWDRSARHDQWLPWLLHPGSPGRFGLSWSVPDRPL